ncbi:cytochrome c [Candidatus Methylacidiphilum fumarolicum]|uniref:Cytochrome c family protein n=2 Tax=Candidatus Methylacidiphilum fumarolicum TaxID=591154 RepID=I0JZ56_METFB|nr:cytochrome c [Candidatus Methylacidiphilum fumarolicum]MBW6414681.1 cytochrome c [Candidatus Methylacidiphilum fumarolicum]TFE74252.1 cytochrome c [Candidatus Methylacidiphilum fumarolicum]TFE75751.1 cytochrome c [Candidatus Methylacidiphilum fumarolicum]TFE75910.1 cytochrome C [Candidatus Methylacidiphilum fumarolicum]CAI9084774.1 Cytochrome c family protein [Candidatus Methylacidiphilum fumarolicum]
MRYFFYICFLLVTSVIATAGLRGWKSPKPPLEIFPDMVRQLKVKEQAYSVFFPDGMAARMPVNGTVCWEEPVENPYLSTGIIGEQWGEGFPIALSIDTLKKGKENFEIYCSACHGLAGYGNGIATRFNLFGVPNYHQDHTRELPDGQIFYIISHGQGMMLGYGANLSVEERWAIVAYIRALQKSQNVPFDALPEEKKQILKEIQQ